MPEESVALTHIRSDLCRKECGIYDEDLIGNVCLHCLLSCRPGCLCVWQTVRQPADGMFSLQDDLFGSFFQICDSHFSTDTHISAVTVPGVACPL